MVFYVSSWLCLNIWPNTTLDVTEKVFCRRCCDSGEQIFGSSRLPPIVWVGLSQSVEGLARKKTEVHAEEGILPPGCLGTHTTASALPWGSSLPSSPAAGLRLPSPHNHVSQFLKIHLSPLLLRLPLPLCDLFVWGTLTTSQDNFTWSPSFPEESVGTHGPIVPTQDSDSEALGYSTHNHKG